VIVTSFATMFPGHDGAHPITIYGTEGTLMAPDPNKFDGTVLLRRGNETEWKEMPHTFVTGYGRAVGLADMAYAVRTGRAFRASGQQAMAVLELMQGFLTASVKGKAFVPTVKYERPAPMPAGLAFGTLDQ
jgi:predicted dehydrogenase